jgi:nitric oxide dioxygenase
MLTDSQLAIVKATVPVLQQHGEAITRVFYKNLFAAHPELKNVFNMANQIKGDQPRALATAVLAYAANIDQLQNLGPAVAKIAHKHCSLDIAAEHYPIVGFHLLEAIGQVLGDAVTPEIVDAWTAAYGQLAEIMISIERSMYDEDAAKGWESFKPFRVVKKERESAVITSFTLEPVDGKPLPLHKAGQYLSVKIQGAGEYVEMRQYTVSCAPNDKQYRISVKREAQGLVSNHLHDNVAEGDEVMIHVPHGDFFLDETSTRPVALFSGGVGITPMLAILERLVAIGSPRSVLFVHAAIDGSVHAFGDRLREIASANPHVESVVLYESPREQDIRGVHYDLAGRVGVETLDGRLTTEAECYFCGPRGFMEAVNATLAEMGIPADRRRYEVFGPDITLEAPDTVAA